MTMNERRKLLSAFGAGALALAARPGMVFAQEKSITVTSLGGRWEQSIRTHFAPLFKQRTGADVRIVLGGPAQWTSQILAQPAKPPLDAVDNSEVLAMDLIAKGMVVKLTTDRIPNLKDVDPLFYETWGGYGVS